MGKIKYLRFHDLSASLPLLVLSFVQFWMFLVTQEVMIFFSILYFVILINLCAALFFCSCLFGTFLYNSEQQRVKEVSVSVA